ncbi:MAG: hypothetical protein GX803_05025 [Lentisphaerae bacterium]|nr:hypothetical protein [Lentisphaerota bacterium]
MMNQHTQFSAGKPPCRMLVAGVGGGAGRILERIGAEWPEPPPMVAINTDIQALSALTVVRPLQIGRAMAKGMGTGGDAGLGRRAVTEDLDALRELVADYDLLLLVASLGGGTGTGAAPVVARIAREEGLLVLAYVTTPFTFEGARRQEQAQEGIASLRQHADAVVTLPNERLHAMLSPTTPLPEAFSFVDKMMGAGLRGLWTLLTRDNILNLDFSDLQTLVENSGSACCFGYGEGRGPDRVEQALAQLLEGPMLDRGRVIANSGAMILCVTGGPDLALTELQTLSRRLQDTARQGASVVMGAAVFDGWSGRLALTLLAAEHWMPPAVKPKAPHGGGLFDETVAGDAQPAAKRHKRGAPAPASDRGMFKDVQPTLHEGVDLDIPTHMRRGIRISSN